MTEPSPIRDVGPYKNDAQVQKQIVAQTFGIGDLGRLGIGVLDLLLGEALVITGIQVSDFELDAIKAMFERDPVGLDEVSMQILCGWILRAYLRGRIGQRPGEPD